MIKWIFIALLSFCCACNLEPHYERPYPPLPCAWRVPTNDESTCANERWWEWLGDPVLNDLILQALSNNKDLQVAIWRVCEFVAKYQIALAPLYPNINLTGTAIKEKFPSSITSLFPADTFNPIASDFTFSFTFSYELDFWGQILSGAHAAYEQGLAQLENRRTVVLTLVSTVAQVYVTLRRLDAQLAIANKTLETRRESLTLARYRFEGGLTSDMEVEQAKSTYEEALASVTNLEREIPIRENLLSLLIGESPTDIIRGKAVNEFTLPPLIPAGLPSDLLVQRPDIVQAEEELIAANAEIGVARAAFFPQITLTGFWGGESMELRHLFSGAARAWQFGANLLQPIFTGGQLTGQLREAEAIQQEALFHYQQVVLNAFREVDDALISHTQAKELLEVEKRRVAALQIYLDLAWLRYYEGQNDYLTVLDAERHLFRAQLDLAAAQGDVFTTLVDVYKALGGGWVIDADRCLRGTLGPTPCF